MGGAEQQMALLVDALVRTGRFEITYLTRQAGAGYVPDGYAIETIPFNAVSMRVGNMLDVVPLIRALKRIRPQVIYQRVGGAYTGAAAWYARRYRARMVWHISSDMNVMPLRMDKNRASNAVSRFLEKKALEYGIRHSDRVIAQTHRQAQLLKQNYGLDTATIIRNFQPVPPLPEKAADCVNVVWISNLKPLKQPELFIELARRLGVKAHVRFIMVGRPENSAWCRQILSSIAQVASLQYTGEKTQDEVNTLLDEAHVLVNTSRYEGFPNTFIQAWMRGVPVVSLDVDPDDILTKHGLGCRSGSVDKLLQDVEWLIGDRGTREMIGQRARDYAVTNFSERNIDLIARELEGSGRG